jgi:hypothetical protein
MTKVVGFRLEENYLKEIENYKSKIKELKFAPTSSFIKYLIEKGLKQLILESK